jgi:phosphoribosylformylglycinamidine synthase
MVGIANMSINAPSDAAVVRVMGSQKAIVITVDCNSRYVQADPEQGCAIAVAESARNIVCTGGEPVAITNCLNFGNPYVPEVYWQFVGAIKGMKRACEKFKTPVTGGNVSFYNQSSDEGPVFPTPTIGMLGLMEDTANRMSLDFKKEGDLIYLIGQSRNDLASAEYLYSYLGIKASPAPYFDIEEEYQVQELIKMLISKRLIESAHDVSDGGLFAALAESAMPRGLGFNINPDKDIRLDAFLFGESQSRVIVSVQPQMNDAFFEAMESSKGKFSLLGKVHAADFRFEDKPLLTSAGARELYNSALSKIMEQ